MSVSPFFPNRDGIRGQNRFGIRKRLYQCPWYWKSFRSPCEPLRQLPWQRRRDQGCQPRSHMAYCHVHRCMPAARSNGMVTHTLPTGKCSMGTSADTGIMPGFTEGHFQSPSKYARADQRPLPLWPQRFCEERDYDSYLRHQSVMETRPCRIAIVAASVRSETSNFSMIAFT